MSLPVRTIAFYLPQFHPIPENDEWWGKGFTEWTNVAKAMPMFKGHYQPHIPADLGFYDLRLTEARIAQAEMAKEFGIEAFCYYHYWFAGKQLLERPFKEVLESGKPDFPFCLCWANQTWTGIWHGCPDRTLIEQTYPGRRDYEEHFNLLLRAFKDKRYVTVDGKPVFVVFKPNEIPEVESVLDLWRSLAKSAGLTGLHLIGLSSSDWNPGHHGFDASATWNLRGPLDWISKKYMIKKLIRMYHMRIGVPTIYSYEKQLYGMIRRDMGPGVENYPMLVPNWDNTPRSGANGIVFHNSTPELFRLQIRKSIELVKDLPQEHRIIFIKSWNEWAEGNHLEPDLRFGKAYLQAIKDELGRA